MVVITRTSHPDCGRTSSFNGRLTAFRIQSNSPEGRIRNRPSTPERLAKDHVSIIDSVIIGCTRRNDALPPELASDV
jgi:hypothetical protein